MFRAQVSGRLSVIRTLHEEECWRCTSASPVRYLTVLKTNLTFLFRKSNFFHRIPCGHQHHWRATSCVLDVAGVRVSGLNPLKEPKRAWKCDPCMSLCPQSTVDRFAYSSTFSRPSAHTQLINHIVLNYQHPHLIHNSSTVTCALYPIEIRRLRFVDSQDPVTGMTFPHSSTARLSRRHLILAISVAPFSIPQAFSPSLHRFH